jgi:hypothetical protein
MSIDDSMIKLFTDNAKKLIEEFGAENAVARLLAYVSGHTKNMKSRSLLCGAEGWITYQIKWKNKFQHVGYVWGFFKRILKEEIKAKIRGLRVISSSDGCVFDFPEDDKEIFENILYNDRFYGTNYVLEIPDDLPELQSIEEQRNRDSINLNGGNKNNFSGGYRPNNPTRMARNNSLEKRPQVMDNSKYMKRNRFDIFVGNLPYNADEVELKNWFEKNGLKDIKFDVRITIDKDTGKKRGFGFVSVFNKEDIDNVIKLNGKEFNHRKLIINEAKK